MEKNIIKPAQGLHTDNSYKEQPKDTYRFALNAVNESYEGDGTFISLEEANEIFATIKPGFTPIGKCYLGNGETAIFSVSSDNTISEIGILQENNKYITHVNDENSTDKLNFLIKFQIDCTYRLRRGCERNIYFTDNFNVPRFFNFDKPSIFKSSGEFAAKKFSLFRTVSKIPKIDDIEILENNGRLTPGSYTILLQYLDENFNGTAFYELVNNVNIINDSLKDNYSDILGSANLGNTDNAYKFEPSNKSLKVFFKDIDEDFPYFRLAIVEYTDSVGTMTSVKYTAPISSKNPFFIYTGENAESKGSIEEVKFFNIGSQITTASHIEQIENRLLLANVKGEQADICKLQKYASRIKADCVVKDTILTNVKDPHNSKNPLVKYNGLSYQPGEIYSFGIMYLFEDNTYSPVMHIPGKSLEVDENMVFTSGENVHPMSNIKNINTSETYFDNASCSNSDFWGRDSEGKKLENENVRHHRFPTRNKLGVGFVEKIETEGSSQEDTYRTARLYFYGNGLKTITCAEGETGCTPYSAKTVLVKATYTITNNTTGVVTEEYIEDALFPDSGYKPEFIESRLLLNDEEISNIQLFRLDTGTGGAFSEIPLTEENNIYKSEEIDGYSYVVREVSFSESGISEVYKAPIFGIKFSGIDLPNIEEIGKKIIGYQIVRQERTRQDKTILDSGVLLPMIKHKKYCSSSLLAPDWETNIGMKDEYERGYPYFTSKRNVNLLSLSHKFTDETYDDFGEIEEVGSFKIKNKTYSGFSIENILDGSSADGIKSHSTTDDDDGFTLKQGIRSTEVEYVSAPSEPLVISNTNTQMYNLDALNYSLHKDGVEELYNMSCDNKSLILSKNDESDLRTYIPNQERFPYVYIKKDNDAFYQNFRTAPYYSYNTNIFPITQSECEDYYGDIYISPMRYSTNIYANFIAARRTEKFSLGKIILMGIIAVVGVALAIFTGGSSAVVAASIIGGIAMAAGASLMIISTIISQEKFAEAYNEKWDKGLDKTMFDIFFHRVFVNAYKSHFTFNFGGSDTSTLYEQGYYRDDTFRWHGEILGDLWFESPVNFSLRLMPRGYPNNFLKPLKPFMVDRPDRISSLTEREYLDPSCFDSDGVDGYWRYKENNLPVASKEDRYFYDKTIVRDGERTVGYKYLGISKPQVYALNADYNVLRNFREYFAIPLEYDCCSKCRETFPHRIHWSEQSFQEELTDNYRTFLPNNYKDIEGETGEITDLLKYSDNLYVHTEEALWSQPKNNQERVTDEIVSFIGTGSYFDIPPRKIIDDDTGASAGCMHKWATVKTPHGIFFVSEKESKIFQFNGQLKPISDMGMENHFQNNLPVELDKQYYKNNNLKYPFRNNPSNPFGTGFISTYDSTKERLIFTKKDKLFTDEIGDLVNYNLCVNSDNLTVFLDVDTTVATESAQGWDFVGVENCKMKFSKEEIKTRIETRTILKTIKVPNNADVVIQLDMSGSFNTGTRQQIKDAVIQWKNNFASSNPDWAGNLYFCEVISPTIKSQRSWKTLKFIESGEGLKDISGNTVNPSVISPNIIAVSFVNENDQAIVGSGVSYHTGNINNPTSPPTSGYQADYDEFVNLYNNRVANGGSFKGLIYPIVYSHNIVGPTNGFLQHAMAALKGGTYTASEFNAIPENTFSNNWSLLGTALQASNPYPSDGLENYGWKGIWNRGWGGSGDIINAGDFQLDMTEFLEGDTTTIEEEIQVEVTYIDTIYKFIEGIVFENPISNISDWTMSYSLKKDSWVSWHSYLPNFYVHTPEKFYSWRNGDMNFWKHNSVGKYKNFYGKSYPHIIEYVSLSNPLKTRVWEDIKLHTEAKKYVPENKEYVEKRFITYNKAILYNSRQCTGEMTLKVKDTELNEDYLMNQVVNLGDNSIIIDRNEKDWSLNDIRDIRVDYSKSIFTSNINARQDNYFIDKVLNEDTLDPDKDWQEMEFLRDKYLVVRLIFDNFDDVNLLINYSEETENISHR